MNWRSTRRRSFPAKESHRRPSATTPHRTSSSRARRCYASSSSPKCTQTLDAFIQCQQTHSYSHSHTLIFQMLPLLPNWPGKDIGATKAHEDIVFCSLPITRFRLESAFVYINDYFVCVWWIDICNQVLSHTHMSDDCSLYKISRYMFYTDDLCVGTVLSLPWCGPFHCSKHWHCPLLHNPLRLSCTSAPSHRRARTCRLISCPDNGSNTDR